MRGFTVVCVVGMALVAAACSSGGGASPSATPANRTATAAQPSAASSPTGAATAATAAPGAAAFPARCTALVSNADVDALAAQNLQLLSDSVTASASGTSQLVCRYQGAGSAADTAIIIVAAGYGDAASARDEDAILRAVAEKQGGTFAPLSGVGDEAYSFTYPTVTGVAARAGSRTVSVGVGKLLGVPTPGEFNTLVQALLSKLGS